MAKNKIIIDVDSVVPPNYDSFEEMLRYFTAGTGDQYKSEGVRVDEVVDELRYVLRYLAKAAGIKA